MNILYIIFFILIIIYFHKYYNHNKKENFTKIIVNNDNLYKPKNKKFKIKHKKNKKHKNIYLNPYFQNTQYNIDYTDVIDAFDNIAPQQKPLFNPSELPLKTSIIKSNDKNINNMVDTFVLEINNDIDKQIGNNNDDKNEKTGWEKHQEKLGLPKSVYKDVAQKAHITLIKIDKIEKHETDKETKYIIYSIFQKINCYDQIVLRLSFVINTGDINLSREFFNNDNNDTNQNNYKSQIIIEEIFILGFLTDDKNGKTSKRKNFYNFTVTNNNGIMNDAIIMKELHEKRKAYMEEPIIS
jgi:hypothetical protein